MASTSVELTPRSVAIVGASSRMETIAGICTKNAIKGGFRGKIHLINPNRDRILGHPCLPSLGSIEDTPDLVLILTNSSRVTAVVEECRLRGVRNVIVVASGHDVADYQRWLEGLRNKSNSTTRVLGPNSIGLALAGCGLGTSFAPLLDTEGWEGSIALVSQSGGVAAVLAEAARESALGVRCLIGTGAEADVSSLEAIASVLDDAGTNAVFAFVEGFDDGWRLAEVAGRAFERGVPIFLVKGGKSELGRRTALSHTGKASSREDVYRDLCKEFCVALLEDEFDLSAAMRALRILRWPLAGLRIGSVSPSGGVSVLVADACAVQGVELAGLTEETREELHFLQSLGGSCSNPVDGTARILDSPEIFAKVTKAVAADANTDAILLTLSGRIAQRYRDAICELAAKTPVILASVGALPDRDTLTSLADGGVALFSSMSQAIRGVGLLRSFMRGKASRPTGQLSKPRSHANIKWLTEAEIRTLLPSEATSIRFDSTPRPESMGISLFADKDFGPLARFNFSNRKTGSGCSYFHGSIPRDLAEIDRLFPASSHWGERGLMDKPISKEVRKDLSDLFELYIRTTQLHQIDVSLSDQNCGAVSNLRISVAENDPG